MAERTTDLQRRILDYLKRHGQSDRDSIARRVGTTNAQATRALNTLADRDLVEQFPDSELWRRYDEPEPCPMGCGRTTDDVAGGPCTPCWEEAPRG